VNTVITVSRKPLGAGNVASNVLLHGCGAINVDASRVGVFQNTEPSGVDRRNAKLAELGYRPGAYQMGAKIPEGPPGRWPANLLLGHKAECVHLGSKQVVSTSGHVAEHHRRNVPMGENGIYGRADMHGTKPTCYVSADGTEVVDAWECVDGCAVAALDVQSGDSKSSGGRIGNKDGGIIYGGGAGLTGDYEAGDPGYGDVGGASRYFKQIGADMNTDIPSDLLDYLSTMITPTHVGGETLTALDIGAVDWASIPDGKYHGVIARGEPTEEQTEHMWRVVKPGAHVLLIAPDERPTGHKGACALEDRGFEIRDAILWVREAGRLHYVPKANTRERNAGCEALAVKRKGAPIYELSEEAAADEELVGSIMEALQAAGVAEDVVESFVESGLAKDLVPNEFKRSFKKRVGGGKYGNVHPCLHPDALVMTPTGHCRISTLKVGDRVYTADGEFHLTTDVSHHPYTSPNLFQIQVLGTNLTTLASDNHPFLIWRPVRTKKGGVTGGTVLWVEAQEMRKGDYTMTPLPATKPFPEVEVLDLKGFEDDPDFWFIFGLYVAEGVAHGSVGASVYPSFSLNVDEQHLVARIRKFFEPRCKVSVYSKNGSEKGIQVVAFDPVVGPLFVELCGKGATKKVLHPMVWNIDRALLGSMFHGHMEGDGGKVRTYWQSKTSSEALSAQLRLVGDALGYRSNHHRYGAKSGSINGRVFKHTSDENHLRFFVGNQDISGRKPSRPLHLDHEGRRYVLSYVKSVTPVPYEGDVWNLSVEGSPTFQTVVGVSHNTVKSREIMVRLLADVPKEALVMDPFMGCYDESTEVLTREGWKFFSDVTDADEILTRATEGHLKYARPEARQAYEYSGEMVQFKSRSTDLLVTPNHNMWVLSHADFNASRPARQVRADMLDQNLYRIPCGGNYESESDLLSREMMYLIGLYVTEGYFDSAGYDDVVICQNKGAKWDEMVANIASLSPRSKGGRRFAVRLSAAEMHFLRENCGTSKYRKFLSPTILKNRHLDALFDAMVLGDGHRTPTGQVQYGTVSPRLADGFQELCLKLGWDSTLIARPPKEAMRDGRLVKGTKPELRVLVRRATSKKIDTHKHVSRVPYEGMVYCLTVPNHTLFVRRNGFTSWCGNSGSTALACLETGHSFIGIEREPDYIEIADARVRYWERAVAGWVSTTIESDVPATTVHEAAVDEGGVFDLFD